MNDPHFRVWLVDNDATIRWVLERALRNGGMMPRTFDAAEPALDALRTESPDVLMTDVRMSGQSGFELLRRIRSTRRTLPIIVMSARADLDSAVCAYESGAFEYLPKPFDVDKAVELAQRAARRGAQGTPHGYPVLRCPDLPSRAVVMQPVFRAIARLARSSVAVLISGESGSGKELVARAIHDNSLRAAKPFVSVNAAAIPAELLEAELFGSECAPDRADAARRGRFEQAEGGTLFLDEVGDLPKPLQLRLMRVLVGRSSSGRSPLEDEVRIIAATRHDLMASVNRGSFSRDLFYLLNVFRIELPPLRSRSEDIPGLLDHYTRVAARELGLAPKSFTVEAQARLVAYDWPGNVRELGNLCRRVCALAPGSEVRVEDLPFELVRALPSAPVNVDWRRALAQWADRQAQEGQMPLADEAQPRFERVLIHAALKHTGGVRHHAAKLLGWGRNTLSRKLKLLGMSDLDQTESSA